MKALAVDEVVDVPWDRVSRVGLPGGAGMTWGGVAAGVGLLTSGMGGKMLYEDASPELYGTALGIGASLVIGGAVLFSTSLLSRRATQRLLEPTEGGVTTAVGPGGVLVRF